MCIAKSGISSIRNIGLAVFLFFFSSLLQINNTKLSSYQVTTLFSHVSIIYFFRNLERALIFCGRKLIQLDSTSSKIFPLKELLKRWSDGARFGKTFHPSCNDFSDESPMMRRIWRYRNERQLLSDSLILNFFFFTNGITQFTVELISFLESSLGNVSLQSHQINNITFPLWISAFEVFRACSAIFSTRKLLL